MPKIELDAIPQVSRTGYPAPFDRAVAGRWHRRLAPACGLGEFGASHVVLKPGAWSSQRHWHRGEGELLVMLSGEAVLVEDDGRELLRPGDICAWPKGAGNGHHVINESGEDCSFLAISAGQEEGGWYSDIDMNWREDRRYYHKDGRAYSAERSG